MTELRPWVPALLLLLGCRDTDEETGRVVIEDSTTNSDSGAPHTPACTESRNSEAFGADGCAAEAPCQWTGDQSYGYFGYSLDAGSDVDGDGRDDVIIGAPMRDGSEADMADSGAAFVISGARLEQSTNGTIATLEGSAAGDYAGTSVALIGDIDADGLADFLVGARGSDEVASESGSARLYFGSAAGWDSSSPSAIFTGERAYARAGTSVGAAGDTNGDGLADFLVGGELRDMDEDGGSESYAAGRVYLFHGSTERPVGTTSLSNADQFWSGEDDGHAAGLGLGGGGDLNGDGFDDPVIGAPYAAAYLGRVYAIPGGTDEPSTNDLSSAPVRIDGSETYGAFGWSVTTGDLDGDGFDELIIGAPLSDAGWDNGGAVHVYRGAPEFFDGSPEVATIFTGEFDDHQLGTGLVARADLTGDGQNDLVMGAVAAWRGLVTKGGRVSIASGPMEEWPSIVDVGAVDVQINGVSVKDYLGRTAAVGDLDGDGVSDLLLGSGYTNTQGTDSGTVYLFWGQ